MKTKRKEPHYGIISHDKSFGTEEQCREYLKQKKWEDGRPTCPHCQNKHLNYYISSRQIWKCSACKKQFSLTQGTIFENTNLPLTTWFKAIYYFTTKKRGLSSCQLAKWLEIEQKTAWFLMHRLRTAIDGENDIILEGPEFEVDDTETGPNIQRDERHRRKKRIHQAEQEKKFGKSYKKRQKERGYKLKPGVKPGTTREQIRKMKEEREKLGKRTPYEQDVVILGILERHGKVVLKKLGKGDPARTKKNIYPHLHRHLPSSAVIFTDQWTGFNDLKKLYAYHDSVHHQKKEFVRGNVHTCNIDNMWLHWDKMHDGTYFHMCYHHFDKYLHEFSFRWNRRMMSLKQMFHSFMNEVIGKRLKYVDLISLKDQPKIAA